MGYRVRPAARRDLQQLWRYIAHQSGYRNRASNFIRQIEHRFSTIADVPTIGKKYDHVHPGLYGYTYKRYVIFYLIEDMGVDIVRIIYGGRDLERALGRLT